MRWDGARSKGKEADRLVVRIDPGVVSLVAELRAHERQAAEELEQWKTHHEERKPLDASPAAITLAQLLTDEELDYLKCCGLLKGPQAAGSTFRRYHRPSAAATPVAAAPTSGGAARARASA